MSETTSNLDELARGSLGRLLLKYSWPALVAMSLNALYAVVDRFYIGHGCGEAAMAGMTLTFPIMMLFGAFGVFVGAGRAAVLSIKLGEKDFVTCEKIVGELIALKLLFFFILPPIIFFNTDTILSWCGGDKVSAEALTAARSYLRIVVFANVFSHLAFGLSALTRAEGGAIKSMLSLVVGFGTNLILDPLFIFGLDFSLGSWLFSFPRLGVVGAAWATVLGMAASFVWAIRYYLTGRTVVILRWWRISFYRPLLLRTSAIGFAPFLQQLLGSLINVSLAASFAKWSATEAEATTQIASLGVFQGVLILTLMPILGAQQGLQPIFGYNWGARNFRRLKNALYLGYWTTTALCVLGCIVQVVPPFSTWVVRLFVSSDNPALFDKAVADLVAANCMFWCIGINVVATTYFQAIGKPKIAIILSTLRQGVILLPCLWILPYFMNDPTLAIWLSLPISDIICQLTTLPPFFHHTRFLTKIRSRG